jgi:hypothetical protein
LLTKWTAVLPLARDKHFLVARVILPEPPVTRIEYFSPSWTAFQADRGRGFSVIVDGVSD